MSLVLFSQVVQKQTLSEMGTRTVVVVSKMFAPKIIKIYQSFVKLQSIMLGMFFDVFLFVSTHILLVHFSQVVQKQTLGEVVKWPVF